MAKYKSKFNFSGRIIIWPYYGWPPRILGKSGGGGDSNWPFYFQSIIVSYIWHIIHFWKCNSMQFRIRQNSSHFQNKIAFCFAKHKNVLYFYFLFKSHVLLMSYSPTSNKCFFAKWKISESKILVILHIIFLKKNIFTDQ